MSAGLLVILVCHAEYEAKHIVACDFTNEIVFPALKSAKSCQTVNIVHLSEQKVMFYRASFTSPCSLVIIVRNPGISSPCFPCHFFHFFKSRFIILSKHSAAVETAQASFIPKKYGQPKKLKL